jgi:hypothetical protein
MSISGGAHVTTADEVREEALSLAMAGVETQQAVDTLLALAADRRISVVLAKRQLEAEMQEETLNQTATRALELVEEVLVRGTWAE